MTKTDRTAISIAVDELDSYIGVMSQDIVEVQRESELQKLQWASRKLHNLLAREPQ